MVFSHTAYQEYVRKNGLGEHKRQVRVAVFWTLHVFLFLCAIFLRATAPSTRPATPQTFYDGELTPSNVCATLNEKLFVLSHMPISDLPAFDAQVAAFDEHLQITLLRVSDIRFTILSPRLIADIRALKALSEHYVLKKSPSLAPADMQRELADFQKRFCDTFFHRVSKPISAWHLESVRASAGLTEGIGAPFVLLWRTGHAALTGKVTLRGIFNPGSWQRHGFIFLGFLFYGSLLSSYLFAFLALKTKRRIFYVPGILAVLYGVGFLFYTVLFHF